MDINDADSIEKIVKKEYHKKEHTSRICKDKVLRFADENKSIKHRSIIFIKNLTKVLHNVYDARPYKVYPCLRRIYKYHLEGIDKINEEMDNLVKAHGQNLIIIESHLHGHAGAIAYELAVRSKSPLWFRISSYHRENSAELIKKIDPGHAAFNYGKAGEAKERLFSFTEDRRDAISAIVNLRKLRAYLKECAPHMTRLARKQEDLILSLLEQI